MITTRSKMLLCMLITALCLTCFAVPAFAGDDSWCEYGDYAAKDSKTVAVVKPEASNTVSSTEKTTASAASTQSQTVKPVTGNATTAASNTKSDTTTKDKKDDASGDGKVSNTTTLTPKGNLTLVDDVVKTSSNKDDELEEKQFITVQSKNGNYFYIVIDRSGDKENVYFLNQVDEADLMALIEDEEVESEPPTCICTDKCMVGSINTACPVCQVAMSECAGKELEPAPDEDAEPDQKVSKYGSVLLLLVVLVMVVAGGGAIYYFNFRKPKTDTKGPVDLDDYDFGEDEEENDDDYPFEPDDADEPGKQDMSD